MPDCDTLTTITVYVPEFGGECRSFGVGHARLVFAEFTLDVTNGALLHYKSLEVKAGCRKSRNSLCRPLWAALGSAESFLQLGLP